MKRIPKGSARSFKTRRYLADRRPITPGAGREEGLGGRDLRAAVKGERPEERFAMRGTDKPGSFQDRSHLLRRMNEDAKGASSEPKEKVHDRKSPTKIPAVGRVGEGQQAARSRGRRAKQRARVGITADDAVERSEEHTSELQSPDHM